MSNLRLPLVLSIPERGVSLVKHLIEASEIYELTRDISGEGASTFPEGVILRGNVQIGRVSYNGRVWGGRDFDQLTFDPALVRRAAA